jgi:hypothetical protein
MKRAQLAVLAVAIMSAVFLVAGTQSQDPKLKQATGVVFHDANANRKFDAGEKTLPGIRVSNGAEIVKTDENGRYSIGVTDDAIVFVVKPKNWRTPISETQLPEFYYIHKPAGSPESKYAGVAPTGPLPKSIDFPLYPQEEPKEFKAIMFGDPQPRNQQEVDFNTHDVVEELVGTDASFGVTLGDIVFDDLNMFEAQAKAIALLGIPWYNVIGNHDINYDAPSDKLSDETFERNFGPAYYSFDYGTVHFIVLDDIEWVVDTPGKRGKYQGGLGKRQIEFVKNDLALISDEQLVVLMMHIPLTNVGDRKELYRLIEKRPACISISGHTHHHEHKLIGKEDGWMGPKRHHHIVNVTVCGSWWSGEKDERGLPHSTMADGGPNGYSILSFNGSDYKLDYKAAGRSADYQMQLHIPDEVAKDKVKETPVYANIFNGSELSKVSMRVARSEWQPMAHVSEKDPTFVEVAAREELLGDKRFRKLPNPKASTHLWKINLPETLGVGVHLVEVKTTDMFGRTYWGRRVVRVIETPIVE